MSSKDKARDFEEGKRRLTEIRQRLAGLFGKPAAPESPSAGAGGFLGGLGAFIERLGQLVEEAEREGGELTRTGEFSLGTDKRVRGVYGFSVRTGSDEKRVKVEPFGNIHKDKDSGRVVVREIREPLIDLFDEPDHVLIVAEVPGIIQEDVRLELHEDILALAAERGEKKYRKEVLLPAVFSPDRMSFTCRNGVLEIKLAKDKGAS